MKRYRTLVSNAGGAQFENPIKEAMLLLGLNPDDFVLVGYGANSSLCIDQAVYEDQEEDDKKSLAITMLTDHIKALIQR